MDSLSQIKNSISDITISNLSKYLGETENGTRLGLNLGLSTFLGSVIKFASNESQTSKLIKILDDGGHTGNIFNNIETFSGSTDKSKLLEAIGGNIVNHFLKGSKTEIIDTLTNISGIKSSSAFSLLNISAPIVLGFIGKKVKEKEMSSSELKAFLDGEKKHTLEALPLSVQKILNINETEIFSHSTVRHAEVVTELNKDKNSALGYILPWLILLGLGLFIYIFSERNKRKVNDKQTARQETIIPSTGLPKDSGDFEAEGNYTDTLLPSNDITLQEDNKELTTEVTPGMAQPKVEDQPGDNKTVNAEKDKPAVHPEAAPVTPKKAVNNTPKDFSELNNDSFKKGSAEISDQATVQSFISTLKGSNKKIVITPMAGSGRLGKDRAYAIREFLYENGVNLSQIIIEEPKSGNNPNGVAFKIED